MARRQNDYLLTSADGHLKAVSLSDLDEFMDWQLGGADQGVTPTDLYASVAWTFWAANLRANLVSSIPYKIYSAESDEDIEENERPFDLDLVSFLWLIEIWLQLAGAAYFLKRANLVALTSLQCLNPSTMRVQTYNADGPLTFRQRVGAQEIIYPAEQIVYFRSFSPKDDIGPGVAPGQVGQYPSTLIRHANQWATKFFENGAIPAVLLTTDSAVPMVERDRIESAWKRALQGIQRAFSTIVLGHGLKAEVIQPPFGELAMPELELAKREQILAAHQLPPGLAEAKTNRAERDALQYEAYIHWIQPWVRAFVKPAINTQLLNPLGLRIGFAWNDIEVIQEKELAKAEAMSFSVNGVILPAYEANLVSIDEARAVISRVLEIADLPKLAESFTPEDRTPPPLLAAQNDNAGPGQPDERQASAAAQAKAGHPKTPAPDGGPPPQLWSDLGKWREKASKRGKPVDFADSSIPDWLAAEVRAAMDSVGVEDAFSFLKGSLDTRLATERRLRAKLDDLLPKYQARMARAIRDGQEPDYDALFEELRAAIQPEITALTTAEAMRASAELGIAFDPAVINTTAVEWARSYSYELVTGLTDTTRKLLQQGAATWYETPGMTLGDLERLLEPAFGPVRSEMIAITETTRAAANATNQTQVLLNQTGLQMRRVWNTANDELVCFPAGTMVRTESGDCPIEQVQVGQRVLTRKGYKKVRTTNQRGYAGLMVTIVHEKGRLTSTADHPIWISKKGWLKARDVNMGDRLQSVTNEESRVLGILQFNIGNAYSNPSFASQKPCLVGIPSGVLMPVKAIGLKRDTKRRQQEIDAIAAHSCLLDIFEMQSIKDVANSLFQKGLTLEAAIASKATELPFSITRQDAKFFSASAALHHLWRASAFLGAVMARVPLFGNGKRFAASLANLMLNVFMPAFKATDSIAVGDASLDFKGAPTDGTDLGNKLHGPVGVVAFPTTVASALRDLPLVFVRLFTAPGTSNHLPLSTESVITFSRTERMATFWWAGAFKRFAALVTNKLKGHITHLLTELSLFYHRLLNMSIPVYNLQVEDVPEFYANGILVHNCPICGPLNGQPEEFWRGDFPDGPPAHPNCRCGASLEVIE